LIKWAVVFAAFSVLTGVFGFAGIVEGLADLAQALFMAALSGFLLFTFLGLYMIEPVE